MKLLFVLIFLSKISIAQVLLTESFDNVLNGEPLSGQGGWSTNNNATRINVNSNYLSYYGYPTSQPNTVNITNNFDTGTAEKLQKSLTTSANSGTVFASFLIYIYSHSYSDQNGHWIFGLSDGSSDAIMFFVRLYDVSSVNFGISKNGSSISWSSSNYSNRTTHCIVVKYTFNNSVNDDQVDLFVDPSPITNEPASSICSVTNGSDASSINYIELRTSNATSYGIDIDEIRIAKSWAEAPLPVVLTSFTAIDFKEGVVLEWITATEVNNYGFEIERKEENTSWQIIGFVQGHGNSNSPKEYSFTNTPLGGTKFKYRLKQIDFDGTFEYSNEIEVNLQTPLFFLLNQNHPNPFNPNTTIKFSIPHSQFVTLKVYDVLGREVATLVNEEKAPGNYEVKFNGSNLPSGVYCYRLQAGSFSQTKKLLLLK